MVEISRLDDLMRDVDSTCDVLAKLKSRSHGALYEHTIELLLDLVDYAVKSDYRATYNETLAHNLNDALTEANEAVAEINKELRDYIGS